MKTRYFLILITFLTASLTTSCSFIQNYKNSENNKNIDMHESTEIDDNDKNIEINEKYTTSNISFIKGQKGIPSWLQNDQTTKFPYENVMIKEKDYIFGSICKKHDCANNKLLIIFDTNKNPISSVLVTVKDNIPTNANPREYSSFRRFGNNDIDINKYLLERAIESWK